MIHIRKYILRQLGTKPGSSDVQNVAWLALSFYYSCLRPVVDEEDAIHFEKKILKMQEYVAEGANQTLTVPKSSGGNF